jgi:hypothetical protein
MAELPSDLEPAELDRIIRVLADQQGLTEPGVHADLVAVDEIPGHVYGLNYGTGLECYCKAQRLRRQLIEMITPDLVAEFRAHWRLNERIEALCKRKGLRFAPWELTPWSVSDEGPPHSTYPAGHPIHAQWPKAQRLRRQLIADIEEGAK